MNMLGLFIGDVPDEVNVEIAVFGDSWTYFVIN